MIGMALLLVDLLLGMVLIGVLNLNVVIFVASILFILIRLVFAVVLPLCFAVAFLVAAAFYGSCCYFYSWQTVR